MYWLYLLLFALTIFAPRLVHDGWIPTFFGDAQLTEMIVLFLVALCSLLLYAWQDYQLRKFLHECVRCKRDTLQASRDLSTLYAYIGEANRKLEMLKKGELDIENEKKAQ